MVIKHTDLDPVVLRRMIRHGEIRQAGNSRLKIYGTLQCRSGLRMRREYRVFFASEAEAVQYGFRPCGHCLSAQYQDWKQKTL